MNASAGISEMYVDVWIDFNNNNQFDDNEKVISGLWCESSSTVYNQNVVFPVNASPGYHRLRFRSNRYYTPGDPCAERQSGNAGDFVVKLTLPPPPPAATVITPLNGANNIIPNTTLHWAAAYRVQGLYWHRQPTN